MKRFLHGDWLGHPLHPLLVHLPMGLWPAALVFDIASRCGLGGEALAELAFAAIALGLFSALLALPTGLADWSDIGADKPAWKIGLAHMILNLIGVVLWAVNLGLRWPPWADVPVPLVPFLLSLFGVILLIIAAYLGGRMVYGYGTYVGWVSIQSARRAAEAGGANVPPEKGG